MKIKTKLTLGIGLLFCLIVLLAALSTFYINALSKDAKNILTDNYNTLEYCREMLNALNNDLDSPSQQNLFAHNLKLQKANITESGEAALTGKLELDYQLLQAEVSKDSLIKIIQNDITAIMQLNMQAIQQKSLIVKESSTNSILWISITGAVCFLLAFTMLMNLPGNIANPIKELTGSIQEIAAQNYDERLQFHRDDEFGDLASAFNTMALKLAEFRAGNIAQLLIEKKRIETLINNMHDPVIGLDENKKVLFMNHTALKILGLQDKPVTGMAIQDLAMQNDLLRLLAQDLFITSEHHHSKKSPSSPIKIFADGKESYFEKEMIPINIIPTGEKEEVLIGNVILLQNITPYKELDFAKTNFIATVSHELKTPISSIKMSLQLLENEKIGTLNHEQHNLVESIRDDAGRLLKITGELLNMTQVESGSIQMNIVAADPAEIVAYAVNTNKVAAEQKNIQLAVEQAGDVPNVMADREKTSWVLTNLISNAIRYSYEHSIVNIAIKLMGDVVQFSVKDTGQGISPEYVEKIFDRYFRVPDSKKEGTGLGLAISKEFIEAQGGQIRVESDYGAGSTFYFSLNTV
ncbi:PAS domain-containing sensor histidine kinase [Chitinophaga caeni]|uniref:histidine kinase n=1 Tax=Chitinophaga caeni TaxID=2029983 RepID=A0A291QXT7_9BACT|nr:ATP-binding protein [Chitinophaga caeni]ATL48750.1 PAS domain-containing sensor histidine kinase [Chitinophaga caeni]